MELGLKKTEQEELEREVPRLTSLAGGSGSKASGRREPREEQVQRKGLECGCGHAKSEVPLKHPGWRSWLESHSRGWKAPRGSLGSRYKSVSHFLTGKPPGNFG